MSVICGNSAKIHYCGILIHSIITWDLITVFEEFFHWYNAKDMFFHITFYIVREVLA